MRFIVFMFLFTAVCGVFDSKIRTSFEKEMTKMFAGQFGVAAAVKAKTP